MKISSRFSVAVHIGTLLAFNNSSRITSDWIAGSVNTNPVVIRRILSQLKKADIVDVKSGAGGATLKKAPEDIRLLDFYQAVQSVPDDGLFHIHENPNPDCHVGANIQGILDLLLTKAQSAMENVLAEMTLQDVLTSFPEKIK